MKKIYKLVGSVMLLAGIVGLGYSAQTCNKSDFLCFESGPSQNLSTPFRVDSSGNATENNATVQGTLTVTGTSTLSAPMGLFSQTVAQIAALTPGTTGQALWCSNCATFNTSKGGICVSSGIVTGAWIQVSSATAVTACQ